MDVFYLTIRNSQVLSWEDETHRMLVRARPKHASGGCWLRNKSHFLMPITYSFVRMPNWIKTLMLVACVSVCILALLLIAIFPRPFAVGHHHWTVHRPAHHRNVSHSDWRAAIVAWTDPEFSTLLLPPVHRPLRSTDLHAFTCTLNC